MIQQLFLLFRQIRVNKKVRKGLLIGFAIVFIGYFSIRTCSLWRKEEPLPVLQVESEKTLSKGFELFDASTWIKGEKELQVLEIRAIKGQLENNLSEFEAVKRAKVILDIPPDRSLRGNNGESKASVILALQPNAKLSRSQLCAITYHLSGAVRGLKPNKIAISDTSGRIYQAIDQIQENEIEKIVLENRITLEIEELLAKVCGKEAFSLSCHVGDEIRVALLLDQEGSIASSQVELEKQIQFLLASYSSPYTFVMTPFSFKKIERLPLQQIGKAKFPFAAFFFSFGVLFVLLTSLLWQKRKQTACVKNTSGIDVKKLAHSLKEEEPKTIASMLTYLSKERAEALLEAFPEDFQQSILKAISDNKAT